MTSIKANYKREFIARPEWFADDEKEEMKLSYVKKTSITHRNTIQFLLN